MGDNDADEEFVNRLDKFLDFISEDNCCGEGMHNHFKEVGFMQPGMGDCGGIDYYRVCGEDIDKLLTKFLGHQVRHFESFPAERHDHFCWERCRSSAYVCLREKLPCTEFCKEFPDAPTKVRY